jgi:hypothetical protein
MKKSNEQRKSDRRKKRDEENFWKIMYLTSDDTDDYTHRPVSIKQRKLPILPFKHPILPFKHPNSWRYFFSSAFDTALDKIDSKRKVFNKKTAKRVGVGVGGVAVGGLLYIAITKYEILFKLFSQPDIPESLTSFATYTYDYFFPKRDGGKEEEEENRKKRIIDLFEKHKDDSIIKEWNDLDLSLTFFETKNYEQIINYFSAFKLVNATLNDYKISRKVMEILKKSITVQNDDNTIDIFCDFLNQVRKEMGIKYDCFSDFKLKYTKGSATSIYIGYKDEKQETEKEIEYNKEKINCEFVYSESNCKNKFMVYLKNIFTKNKDNNEDNEGFETADEEEER